MDRIKITYIEGRIGKEYEEIKELIDKEITPEQIAELAKKYDLLVICREDEIRVLLDKKGYKFKQR